MYIKEFAEAPTSVDLNAQLSKVYNWNLNLHTMQGQTARDLLSSVNNKIRNIRNSRVGHTAERNPQFMEAVLVSRVLETWLTEQELRYRENYERYLAERSLTKGEKGKREKYVKGMKKVGGEFEKRYPGRGKDVMYATATKMAKTESVEEAFEYMRSVLYGTVQLTESEISQARAFMAAKDMVDSLQKMVEELSELMNEELPALSDAIRDDIGDAQAQSFVSAANSSIGPLLDSLRQAREQMDGAVRGLTGEGGTPMMGAEPVGGAPSTPSAMPPAPPAPTPDMGGSQLDTSDSAAGGVEQPMGRSKR